MMKPKEYDSMMSAADKELAGVREAIENCLPVIAVERLNAALTWHYTTLQMLVRDCRETGSSWTTIGQALGTSRQAAQQRFG